MDRRSYHEFIKFLCRTGGASEDVNTYGMDAFVDEIDIEKANEEDNLSELTEFIPFIGKSYAYFCACAPDFFGTGAWVPFLDGNTVIGFYALDYNGIEDDGVKYDKDAGVAYMPR